MNDEYANNKIIHGYCLLLISAFFRGLTSQEINSDRINHVPKLEYRIIIIIYSRSDICISTFEFRVLETRYRRPVLSDPHKTCFPIKVPAVEPYYVRPVHVSPWLSG